MSDVPAGKMRLYSVVRPVWRPGRHFLWINQRVTAPGGSTPLVKTKGGSQTEHVFDVTGPRTTLPPQEILGAFPPPGSPEAQDTALPHVVLRRRTLPWERALTSANADATKHPPADTPWMALLVVPEGAGAVEAAPLSQAYTASMLQTLKLDGATVCDQLVIPQYALRPIMPRKEDLGLLAHARQLSLTDKEAKDDDDGFLALVVANRLPIPGEKSLLCLVSLEGWWDYDIWPKAAELAPVVNVYGGGSEAAVVSKGASKALVSAVASDAVAPDAAADDGGSADLGGGPQPGPTPTPVPPIPPADLVTRRLVVLHAWEIQAGQGGDFAAAFAAMGEDHVQRFGAEHTEGAGFTRLKLTDRSGAEGDALYRGPLTPVPLARSADHPTSADGALQWTPEGQPVLSGASAFELGRLLTQASEEAMTGLLELRGQSQEQRVERYLIEDHYAAAAKEILGDLPPDLGEVFSGMWDLTPTLDPGRLQAFPADPSGIGRLMEQVPGLTWKTLATVKPEMLNVDFSPAQSIAAKAALGQLPFPGGGGQLPPIDIGQIPLMDPDLGGWLDVGLSHLIPLAAAEEDPQE